VDVPERAPDAISSTVVLTITGQPEISAAVIGQESDGSVRLPASEADLDGELKYEVGDGKDNIGFWVNPTDTASWNFKVTRPGKFQVTAEIASQGQGSFELSNTGEYTKFQRLEIVGALEIAKAGDFTLTVKPITAGWQPMNLKSLTLKPASR
jgi:hypothetical protein